MKQAVCFAVLMPLAAIPTPGATAFAQQPATTVQLPTFSQFTVRTTVSVPDGGTAYLGGVERAADSSVTRGLGPLKSRATSSARAASGVSVHATIIDHAEMDRAILAAAKAGREPAAAADLKAREIAKALAPAASAAAGERNSAAASSLSAIRAAQASADARQAEKLAGYLAQAERAEAQGKTGVAKVYYQMVARSSSPHRQHAAARLAAISKPSAAK